MLIELLGFNGRNKLGSGEHFTTLFQYSQADLEAIAVQSDT